MKIDDALWLGTENSLTKVLQAAQYGIENAGRASEYLSARALEVSLSSPYLDNEEEYEPFYEIIQEGPDGAGIINIVGGLVAEDSWLNSLFGLVSYESIIKAVHYFREDADTTSIILNIDSPGGTVAGVDSAGEAIKSAANHMPVLAHVNGSAFSAAYWLASSANSINASKMSEVGSIGVLMTVRTMQRLYEESGIDVHVITAGKYKGLGHPAKELSEEDRAILQQKAVTLYSFFLEKIVTDRPSLSIASKGVWAEGKTFFAEEGLAVNLVDTVMSTDKFFEAFMAERRRGHSNNGTVTHYSQENIMPKSVVLRSEEDKAALESGVDIAALETEEQDDNPAAEAAGSAGIEAQASLDEGESTDVTAEGEDTSAEVSSDTPVAGLDGLLSKVSALTEENATLKSEAKTASAKIEELETSSVGLVKIAIEATHKMQIALNQDPLALEDLPVSTVVAQYQKVRAAFNARFKVGQSTRQVSTTDEEDAATATTLGIVPK